ncbi:MAG: TrkA family potassium uptake protein [Candidatus Aegiribacteria sp.]
MNIVVAGAGLVGRELTRKLLDHKHDVVVIDIDNEVCESIYAETGAVAVNGSATSLAVLKDAGVHRADILICLMRNDVDNIACSILARSLGVPRILARMRDPGYENAYSLSGVTVIVRVADLLLDQLLMEVEQPPVKRIMSLGGGDAYVYAVRIPEGARCIGKSVKEVAGAKNFPKESLLMGIYREDDEEFQIPRGNYVLSEDDTVFVIAHAGDIQLIADALGT